MFTTYWILQLITTDTIKSFNPFAPSIRQGHLCDQLAYLGLHESPRRLDVVDVMVEPLRTERLYLVVDLLDGRELVPVVRTSVEEQEVGGQTFGSDARDHPVAMTGADVDLQ